MVKNTINSDFWKGKRVLVTGHTGFKGSWLCLILNKLGANIYGYALAPPTQPSLYHICKLEENVQSTIHDIRNLEALKECFTQAQPEIVIHMAAQALVRASYQNPVETYATNVMGTVHLLEAIRNTPSVKALVNVTTDKCYENKEWQWGYRENEPMGGFDPYSSSKACSELVTAAFRNSFFHPKDFKNHHVAIATARAGNVIGGGDWAKDRLIPDFIRAIASNENIVIRNPEAIRPWQHVLEPLSAYLKLAEKLYTEGVQFAEAWNFGPKDEDAKNVEWIVEKMCQLWSDDMVYSIDNGQHPHEATYLKLDCSKAKNLLDWHPQWNLEKTLETIIEFAKCYENNGDIKAECHRQINDYFNF